MLAHIQLLRLPPAGVTYSIATTTGGTVFNTCEAVANVIQQPLQPLLFISLSDWRLYWCFAT
jgi:hypothetical protein